MDDATTPTVPPRRRDLLVLVLSKFESGLGQVGVAVGAISRSLEGAIRVFSKRHGELAAANVRIERKLDAILARLGVDVPDETHESGNGNGHAGR